MLAFITPLISQGVIDNTQRDRIELTLTLNHGGEPLHLELCGNCLQDIAGCRVEFELTGSSPTPRAEGAAEPSSLQLLRAHKGEFIAGDITLSRRERAGNSVHNLLSIEFFAEARVRVLIQAASFRFRIERGSWRLSAEEDTVARLLNREVLHAHVLSSVRHYRGATVAFTGADFPLCHWDVRLNRAEAYMSIIPTLREKYHSEPDGPLSEAYLVDRTDLLTDAAEAEDRCGHGVPPRPHAWELIDFVEPEHVDQVSQAMQHPLFADTSRMSEAVLEHILAACGEGVPAEFVQHFLPPYAGVVSHILSTLLLTMDERYCIETAARRLETLRHRLAKLAECIEALPEARRVPLLRACDRLASSLSAFCSTLH